MFEIIIPPCSIHHPLPIKSFHHASHRHANVRTSTAALPNTSLYQIQHQTLTEFASPQTLRGHLINTPLLGAFVTTPSRPSRPTSCRQWRPIVSREVARGHRRSSGSGHESGCFATGAVCLLRVQLARGCRPRRERRRKSADMIDGQRLPTA